MNNALTIDPSKRQVLVNLGNRFVVFGPEGGLPEPPRFDPKESAILPRVADESDVTEAHIARTLQVFGLTRGKHATQSTDSADIELVDSAGNRILVEVKVREREPKKRDIDLGIELIKQAKSKDQNLEVWFFNIERLKLTVMGFDKSGLRFDELVPMNVWERTEEGIFERQHVVEEVEDWLRRVERLYADVLDWLGDNKQLHFEQKRTVTMSEEIMQKFAVTDRELPVLDILRDDQVVASFVPRGLWILGAWGRIDVITKDGTSVLVAIKKHNTFEWQLTSPNDRRRRKPFGKSVLLELVSGQ